MGHSLVLLSMVVNRNKYFLLARSFVLADRGPEDEGYRQ